MPFPSVSSTRLQESLIAARIRTSLVLLLLFSAAAPFGQAQTWITAINESPGTTAATITWSTVVPADSEVRYGLTTNYGNRTALNPVLLTSHAIVLTSLSAAKLYHFRIMSHDSSGVLVTSSDGTFTTQSASPILAVNPTTLEFSAQQGGSNPSPADTAITNTGGGSLNFTAATDVPWLIVSPTSGTAPTDLQVAASIAGVSAGNYTGHVSITAPGAGNSPTVITASLAVTAPSHWVSLTWKASTDQHVVSYNLYRSNTSGGPYGLAASAITGVVYADQTVQPGQTYYYVTTSVDDQGRESGYSNQTSAIIP